MLTGIGYDALGQASFLEFYNAHATKAKLARPRSLSLSGMGKALKVEGEYSTRLIQTGH